MEHHDYEYEKHTKYKRTLFWHRVVILLLVAWVLWSHVTMNMERVYLRDVHYGQLCDIFHVMTQHDNFKRTER